MVPGRDPGGMAPGLGARDHMHSGAGSASNNKLSSQVVGGSLKYADILHFKRGFLKKEDMQNME